MPAGNWIMFGNAMEQTFKGGIDWDSNAFRMILVTSAWTPDQDADDTYSDLSANEVANGNGYTTGGKLLTVTVSRTAGTNAVDIDCDDQSWTSSTITAKRAVIVRDANADGTLAAGDLLCAYVDLETGGGSLSTTNGTFAITVGTKIYTTTPATS